MCVFIVFKTPLHTYDFTAWRYQLELAISMPFLLLIGYWWLTPESPRWLLSQNRSAEALQVVKSIAKWNGKSLDEQFYIHFKQMVADLSEAEGKARGLRPDNMTAMLRFYPSTRKNFALSGILDTFILINYLYQNWSILQLLSTGWQTQWLTTAWHFILPTWMFRLKLASQYRPWLRYLPTYWAGWQWDG